HIEFGTSTKLGYFGKNGDELIRDSFQMLLPFWASVPLTQRMKRGKYEYGDDTSDLQPRTSEDVVLLGPLYQKLTGLLFLKHERDLSGYRKQHITGSLQSFKEKDSLLKTAKDSLISEKNKRTKELNRELKKTKSTLQNS
ncbi:hypothetical protein ACJX0J_037170, partial [Zea mays]